MGLPMAHDKIKRKAGRNPRHFGLGLCQILQGQFSEPITDFHVASGSQEHSIIQIGRSRYRPAAVAHRHAHHFAGHHRYHFRINGCQRSIGTHENPHDRHFGGVRHGRQIGQTLEWFTGQH